MYPKPPITGVKKPLTVRRSRINMKAPGALLEPPKPVVEPPKPVVEPPKPVVEPTTNNSTTPKLFKGKSMAHRVLNYIYKIDPFFKNEVDMLNKMNTLIEKNSGSEFGQIDENAYRKIRDKCKTIYDNLFQEYELNGKYYLDSHVLCSYAIRNYNNVLNRTPRKKSKNITKRSSPNKHKNNTVKRMSKKTLTPISKNLDKFYSPS
jgi:viroplasmin and RNaseH domain-containing protein